MADETKKYLIDIQSNLKKYTEEAAEAKKKVDELTAANKALKESGTATGVQIEQSNAKVRDAQKEYSNAKKSIDLVTQANKAEKGSYEELYKTWQLAQTQLKLMGKEYVTNAAGQRVLSQRYIDLKNNTAGMKKELDAFGKSVHDNRLNVGAYSEAIEGALGKFSALPGPIGAAAGAVISFGSKMLSMLSNPFVAGISAISLAVGGLFKAFTSTQTGGTMLKEFTSQWHAVFAGIWTEVQKATLAVNDFLASRKTLYEAKYGKNTDFEGGNTAEAKRMENAKNLVTEQKELNFLLAAHTTEEVRENTVMQEARMLAKDKTKSDQERIDLLEKAISASKSKHDMEKVFATEQFKIDVDKLANDKKMTESEAKVFEEWLKLDMAQQVEMKKSNPTIKKYYDLIGGSEAFNALQVSYAKILQSDADYYRENQRTTSQLSTLKNEIAKEDEARIDKQIELRKLQAGTDVVLMKSALTYEFDEKSKMLLAARDRELDVENINAEQKKKIESDTLLDLKILKIKYLNDIAEINKKAFEQEKAIKKIYTDADIARQNKETDEAIKIIDDEIKETLRLEKLKDDYEENRLLINEENKRAIIEGAITSEYELKVSQLQADYDAEIAASAKTGADTLLIDKKFAGYKLILEQETQAAKFQIVGNFAGAVASLFKKNTIAYKVAALAETAISTYAGAQKAFEANAKIPPSPLFGILAAASAVAFGLKNVQAILNINPDSSSAPAAPTAITSSPIAQRTFAPQVNPTILNQPQLTQPQLNALPQGMLTAAEIGKEIAKLPAPVVYVEAFEKVSNAKKKIEIRATI
jgi:hypothetical protein